VRKGSEFGFERLRESTAFLAWSKASDCGPSRITTWAARNSSTRTFARSRAALGVRSTPLTRNPALVLIRTKGAEEPRRLLDGLRGRTHVVELAMCVDRAFGGGWVGIDHLQAECILVLRGGGR
jgi:hypothetical protein